jgi:hypothetical protein
VEVLEADALRQPFGQAVEVERLRRRRRIAPLLVGDDDQRMQGAAVIAPLLPQRFGRFRVHPLVLEQPVDDLAEAQPGVDPRLGVTTLVLRIGLNCLLHRQKTIPQTPKTIPWTKSKPSGFPR